MNTWEAIGWVGQGLFFSRFLIQWLASEKAKRSTAPRVFWWLSIAGAVMVGSTAVHEREWVLVPAFLVNGAIYARNLALAYDIGSRSRLGPVPAAVLGGLAGAALVYWGANKLGGGSELAWPWLLAGICGQAVWGTRFVVQWWFSERRGLAHFPLAFWWMSLVGAVLNLAYTSQLESWLFLIAYVPAWFVPLRNLMIEAKRRRVVGVRSGK